MFLLLFLLFLAFLEASEDSQTPKVCKGRTKRTRTASAPMVQEGSEEKVESRDLVLGQKALCPNIDLTMDESTEKKGVVVERLVDEASCLFSPFYFEIETEASTPFKRAVNLSEPFASPSISGTEGKVPRGFNMSTKKVAGKTDVTPVARKRVASMQPPKDPPSKRQKIDSTLTISCKYPMGWNWKTHTIQIGSINRLVLFNLAHTTGIPELLNVFNVYGTIEEIEYVDDSLNCRPNIAFLRFSNKLALVNAIANTRNMVIDGNILGTDDCFGRTFNPKERTIEVLIPPTTQVEMEEIALLFQPEIWARKYMHVVKHMFNQHMRMGMLTFNLVEDAQQAAEKMTSFGFTVLDNTV